MSGRAQMNSAFHMPMPASGSRSFTRSSPFGPKTATCPARHLRPEPMMQFQTSAVVSGAAETISTSIAPPVSGHVPMSRAGKTFVSFTTRRSFGSM